MQKHILSVESIIDRMGLRVASSLIDEGHAIIRFTVPGKDKVCGSVTISPHYVELSDSDFDALMTQRISEAARAALKEPGVK